MKEEKEEEAKEASSENATPTTIIGRGARGPTASSTTFAADAEARIQSIVAPTAQALRHREVHQQQNRKLPRSKELVLPWNLNLLQHRQAHRMNQNLHRPSLNDGGLRHHCMMTAAKYSTLFHLYRPRSYNLPIHCRRTAATYSSPFHLYRHRRYNLPLPRRRTAETYTTPFHHYRLQRYNLPIRRLPQLQLARTNLAPA